MEPEMLTLGIAATRLGGGLQHHHLHRLARDGRIPSVPVGRMRLVRVSDFDTIREVCAKAGFYKPESGKPKPSK